MGKIELHESFLGGLSGTVQVEPTLSWRDSLALEATADATRHMAGALSAAAVAVRMLEYEIGLKLEAQTRNLERQVDLLAEIAASLRTPGRVRAAERVAATGELLRRGRYARARDMAVLAIEDDPNNSGAFTALAWSQMGLGELELARESFAEAVAAADDDDKSRARRAQARLTFALDDGAAALALLEDPIGQCSPAEQAAVRYDRAVYLCEVGDLASAKRELLEAADVDVRHLHAASDDPQMTAEEVRSAARSELARRRADLDRDYQEITRTFDAAMKECQEQKAVLARLTESSREVANVAVLDVLEALQAIQAATEDEYQHATVRLANFPGDALRARAEEILTAARGGLIDLEAQAQREESGIARAERVKALEQEALRVAGGEKAIPYLLRDGSWTISIGKRGQKRDITLWLDDAGNIQRTDG